MGVTRQPGRSAWSGTCLPRLRLTCPFPPPSIFPQGLTPIWSRADVLRSPKCTHHPGGETAGLERLEAHVAAKSRREWVLAFEKPKTSPNRCGSGGQGRAFRDA